MSSNVLAKLFLRLGCACFLAAAWLLAGPGSVQAKADLSQLSPQEAYVLQQAAAGLPADLQERFGVDDKGRVLRGAFLEALLTNEVPGFKAHRRGVAVKNAVINDYLDLRSAEVPLAVELTACRFQTGFNFSYCLFKKSLSLNECRVVGWAFCNGLKVESDASLNGATFSGGAFFEGAAVAGNLAAREARFDHPKLGASFANFQAGNDVDFMKAGFQGNVFFTRMRIKGNFSIFQADFGDNAYFDGSEVSGDFNAMSARFHGDQAPVYLTNLKVGQRGFFGNLTAPGGVSMAMAHFLDLFVGSTEPAKVLDYQQLTLDYAVVDRVCDLRNMRLNNWSAKKFLGKDLVWLDNVEIKNDAHLESSSYQTLLLLKVKWPGPPNHVWLDEMTYQNIAARDQVAEEGSGDWLKLLSLVNHSNFSTQIYYQLEAYFQRRGEKDRADEVYIQGKRRETLQKWWQPGNLATLVFWDGLAGYGKKPVRTLWVSLLIVFLGTLVFDHRNFDPSFIGGWGWLLQGDRAKTAAVRFFLSLDEFLPGIDLGLAKLWQLSKISFPELMYYHFHKIAGWVLIPIGLAAVYTQFK